MIPNDLVTIRLEVGSMRQTVLHAMSAHQQEIQRAVEEAADRVCTLETIQNLVRVEAEQALRVAVKDAIQSAMVALTYDQDVRDGLRDQVAKALAPWLDKERGETPA